MSSKDEEADKPDEAGDAPSRQKRPAQTIDLKADEVEIEIREVGATDKDGGEGGSKRPDADESAKTSEPKTTASDADETKPGGASGPAGHKGAIPGRKPPPPPQRTRPSDVRGFVTHLAAGLVGGLVGVVGAGVGLDRLPIPGLGAPDPPGQDLAQLEQRIESLSAKIREQPDAASGAASPEKLGELEQRLAAIEKKPPSDAPPLPENLETRIAGLEDTLKALQASGGEAGAGALEQSAALIARIDAIEQATREKVDTLANDLSQARAAIDKAASNAAPAADTAALEAMSRRIAGLEKSLSNVATARPDTGGGAQPSGTGAVALAYESLRRAAQAGEPFKTQLDVLTKIAGPRDQLKPLAIAAARGVPTRAALLEKWPSVLEQARLEAAKADDETFFDRLASNASAVVRIRRVERNDAAAGAEPGSGFAAAVTQAEALEGAAAKAAEPWLEKAHARIVLDTALEALEAALLSGLTGAPPEKG